MTEPLAQPVPHPKWSRIGFWWRVLAALLDAVFLLAIALIIALVAVFAMELIIGSADIPNRVAEAGGSLLGLLYTLTEIFFAATPGKLVLRMRIMHIDGTAADKWQLILRWSTKQSPLIFGFLFDLTQYGGFKVVGGLCGTVVLIGCLFASNDDKLAWHDQWCKTAIYPAPKKQPQGFEVMQPPQAS